MSKPRIVIGPVQLKCDNFGVDTYLVNFKFVGPDDQPNGDTLPEELAALLDMWQKKAASCINLLQPS